MTEIVSTPEGSSEPATGHEGVAVDVVPPGAMAYKLARLLLVVVIVLLGLPAEHPPLGPGLDPSWGFAIGYLSRGPFLFGRDVVFTYGPLGYLLHPLAYPELIWRSMALGVAVQAVLACLLVARVRSSAPLVPLALFGLTYLLCPAVVQLEQALVVVQVLWFLQSVESGSVAMLVLGALAAGVLLFLKTTLGLCGLFLLLCSIAVWPAGLKPRQKVLLPLCAAFYVATLVLLGHVLVPGYLGPWLRGAVEVADGYSAAMSVVGSRLELAVAVAQLGAVGLACTLLYVRRASLAPLSLLIVGPAFLCFKHGIVRHDGHILIATCTLPCLMACLLLHARTRDQAVICATLVAAMVLGDVKVYGHYAGVRRALVTCVTSKRTLLEHLASPRSYLRSLEEQTQSALAANRFSDAFADELVHSPSVSIIPWELSYAYLYPLAYRPLPTLQAYSGYTPYLDRLNARFLAESSRPHELLLSLDAIDGRHPFFEAPGLWKQVLEQYQPSRSERGYMLLRAAARESRPCVRGKRLAMLPHQWVSLPGAGSMATVRVDLRYTVLGGLAKKLFRVDPVEVEVLREDGEVGRYRLVAEVASEGLIMGHLPTNLDELSAMFSSEMHAPSRKHLRVRAFRLTGPGLACYRSPILATLTVTQPQASEASTARTRSQAQGRAVAEVAAPHTLSPLTSDGKDAPRKSPPPKE